MLQELMQNGGKKAKLTIEDVRESYQSMYNSVRIHPMEKIRLKAWLYHSESRNRNGNPPFQYEHYTHAVGKQLYLDYIEFGLIDCEDLGGKDKAISIISNYYR